MAQLFFGRNVGDGEGVSDTDWQSFVDSEITPRFSSGFTVIDTNGQWKAADGTVLHERGKLVIVSGSVADTPNIESIRAHYKSRFHQESVLLVETQACASF